MAADLSLLVPELRTKLELLLKACADRGVTMRPYDGLREPVTQAKFWRQSRSSEEVAAKIAELRSLGADFLADAIVSAGPQNGPHITGAIPGLSWHQWGEGCDSFWLVDSKAEWSTTKTINGVNGYQLYAAEAVNAGLTAGGNWPNFKDWPHVQLRATNSPLHEGMSITDVDRAMRERFGS